MHTQDGNGQRLRQDEQDLQDGLPNQAEVPKGEATLLKPICFFHPVHPVNPVKFQSFQAG
jgi:hypothetical protein